jgi:UDP-N-acetylglucosamine acyltransferase
VANIHPSSFVDPRAELAGDVEVGPFCYVREGAILGAGCRLESHVTVFPNVTAGERNVFAHGAVIGGDPQDRKYSGEPTYLQIGDDNVFREYVTVHRATGEGNLTAIGNRCFLMAYCHVGHNSIVEDGVTMANSVGVSGHVTIEEGSNIGGMTGIHQFVRVGRFSMVGGFTKITTDVPPFMIIAGSDPEVRDINAVGLRRMGITAESRMALHKACKLIFKSRLNLTHALETVRREVKITPEVAILLEFEERRQRGKNGRGDQP